ncbi:MAG: DNA polymerase I [Fermentimonas sp.]|nr:DNA polymerase I [Fermentimonas sp.]
MIKNRLFLLDAYALIYRAYYAFIRFPRIDSKGRNTSAIFGFVNTLEDVLRNANPTHIAVGFDPAGPTFRHDEYKDYKAQREATPEVIKASIPIIKEIINAYNIPILEVPGFEADDVIGTLAKKMDRERFDVYMMTSDKDYGQLTEPSIYIYRPKYGGNDYEILNDKNVIKKYGINEPSQVIDLLGLMGDSSDNIPGCPGVGEKTAIKLLNQFGTIEKLLENTDKLKGAQKINVEQNREQILFSKYLATIRTDVPIDINENELILKEKNEDDIKRIFEDLEFKTLLVRIFKQDTTPTPSNTPIQGNLFADDTIDESPQSAELELSYDYTDIRTTPHTYKICKTDEEMNALSIELLKQKSVCFDTETTGMDPLHCELVGISFAYKESEAYYIPISENQEEALRQVNIFKSFFESENIEKSGQNIKYDILVLRNYGIKVKGPLFDTMVAHYLLNPELRHGMDYMADIYLKYQTIHIESLIGPKGKNQLSMRDVDTKIVAEYAAEDADVTLKLKNILEKDIHRNGFDKLFYEIEAPLIYVLADMEWTGVRLDLKALKDLSELYTDELKEVEKEIIDMAGIEFNVNSPKQTGEILFDRLKIIEKAKKTKTGQYKTGEEELEKIRSKHPIIGMILEQRGLKKLLSTYIDSFPLLINKKTGKIHTSFNQTVAATGRLSSTNPNLQNIPIRDARGRELRRVFIPDGGDIFMSSDYSQIELRIMAHLSEDINMLEAFNKGQDIHTATASKIFKTTIEEVDADMRRKAKTANFGIIYGISPFGLSERLTIPRSEAKNLIDDYFATFSGVKKYMDESIEKGKTNGYVETIYGRKRFLPDISSRNATVRGFAERNAINAPIQGSAADIIKVAMVRIYERLQKENKKSKMILQVHDELNFNVVPDELEYMKKMVVEEMENAAKLTVSLKTEIGVGENWLVAH